MDISNAIVRRMLVDIGSSMNVMYYEALTQLGLSKSKLNEVKTPLSRFTRDSNKVELMIKEVYDGVCAAHQGAYTIA